MIDSNFGLDSSFGPTSILEHQRGFRFDGKRICENDVLKLFIIIIILFVEGEWGRTKT